MNDQLLKELKDKGFPIPDCPEWIIRGDGPLAAVIWKDKYVPTFSDLIEACGILDVSKSFHLSRISMRIDPAWSASLDSSFNGQGSTPEEAVANLWLALNKK